MGKDFWFRYVMASIIGTLGGILIGVICVIPGVEFWIQRIIH